MEAGPPDDEDSRGRFISVWNGPEATFELPPDLAESADSHLREEYEETYHLRDTFWPADGSTDLTVLSAKVSELEQSCLDLSGFVKMRAQIEHQYAKELERLAAKAARGLGALESTTVRKSMIQCRVEAENMARHRKDFAGRLSDELSKGLDTLAKEMKSTLADLNQKHLKAKDEFQKQCAVVTRLQQVLRQKTREAQVADKLHNEAYSSGKVPHKKIKELWVRLKRAEEAVQNADNQYRSACNKMPDAEAEYFGIRNQTCDSIQSLLDHRANTLSELLILYSSMEGEIVPIGEHIQLRLRKAAEDISPTDIQELISKARLKGKEPPPIAYEQIDQSRSSGREAPVVGGQDLTDGVSVIKEGWLHKTGGRGHRFKTKRKRYFVLSKDELLYFSAKPVQLEHLERERLKGRLPLSDCSIEPYFVHIPNTVVLRTGTLQGAKEYYVTAATRESAQEWLDAINEELPIGRRFHASASIPTSAAPSDEPAELAFPEPPPLPPSLPQGFDDDDNEEEDEETPAAVIGGRYRALYPYAAQSERELNLEAGDIITVVGDAGQADGWWTGQLERTGETGDFPGLYVEPEV